MASLRTCDLVWNRACFSECEVPRAGDEALTALLAFHGPAMNGGVLHAVELLGSEQLAAACEGFRYFGFGSVAALIEDALRSVSEDGDLDALEQELDGQYSRLILTDSALANAFERDFSARPENYAPV